MLSELIASCRNAAIAFKYDVRNMQAIAINIGHELKRSIWCVKVHFAGPVGHDAAYGAHQCSGAVI